MGFWQVLTAISHTVTKGYVGTKSSILPLSEFRTRISDSRYASKAPSRSLTGIRLLSNLSENLFYFSHLFFVFTLARELNPHSIALGRCSGSVSILTRLNLIACSALRANAIEWQSDLCCAKVPSSTGASARADDVAMSLCLTATECVSEEKSEIALGLRVAISGNATRVCIATKVAKHRPVAQVM